MNDVTLYSRKFSVQLDLFLCLLLLIMGCCVNVFLNDLKSLTILSLGLFVVGIFTIKIKIGSLFSFANLFFVLCYLFHCSYFVLIMVNNVTGNAYMFNTLSQETLIETIKYCNYFFNFFLFGICLCKVKKISISKTFIRYDQLHKIGFIICCVTLLPRMYVDYLYIRAYLLHGYLGTFSAVNINNYLSILANMFFLGATMAILGKKNKKKIARRYFIFTIFVALVGMISGGRAIRVCYLLVLIFIYFKYVDIKKRNVRKILLRFNCGYTVNSLLRAFFCQPV